MNKNEITMEQVLYESHLGLKRQGPGSREMTLKALNFCGSPDKILKVLDLGCGTGGQSMVLAQSICGEVIGVDRSPEFIAAFNDNAQKLGFNDKAKGIVASFDALPFDKAEFDIIWSEGAIEKDLKRLLLYWSGLLKTSGFVAFTIPTWFTETRPTEIEKFWSEADCAVGTIAENSAIMQKAGYDVVSTFTLPEICWLENYFVPRTAAENELKKKYKDNKTVEEYIASSKYEFDLYLKYKEYYGYAFYIGKKI